MSLLLIIIQMKQYLVFNVCCMVKTLVLGSWGYVISYYIWIESLSRIMTTVDRLKHKVNVLITRA